VVDLAAEDCTAQFAHAYGQIGFGYVVGHGIPQGLIDATFTAARAFHDLPEAEKKRLAVNAAHRGYIGLATSTDRTTTLAEVTKPNQSSSFMLMREDSVADPDVYLSGPNQWPDLPGFRQTMESYIAAMSDLARRLLGIALDAAGIADRTILAAFDTPTIWLRLLHYPPQPPQTPDDLYGSAPHTDFGALTLLAQDPVGGLEVMAPDGTWLPAPYRPGSFVVNVGDMLHRLTNGRLRSTPHRVINRSGRERLSIPFFFDPHVLTEIAPLPGTGTPRFEPVRFDVFLRGQLEATYDAHDPSAKARITET
jgi:isopenicillin N synthase-like dioxygenase